MNAAPKGSSTRYPISPTWLLSSLALILTLFASCMPIQSAAAPEAITLRFAISDGEGLPRIDNYVHEFADQVHTLSQGKITIELVWEAGNGTFDGYEKGTLQRVLQSKYDLGLVASRTWDSEAITNFQALHAPFLITNDALAEAVASGAIGKRMLDSLSAVGLVGLTLWPEDLRHPFSVVPDKPLLAPQDFAGLHIRTPLSDVSYQLIDALGAMPMSGDGGYEGAESGLLQGGTLTGKPIATGNITFYSKFQVLFANADAFNRLSAAQQAVLHQAATAAQSKAIVERPKEVDAATAYCADGGTIVLASAEQIAAFEQAAQPVFDNLAQDLLNAELIAAIRDLKAQTTPSAGAAACAPTASAPNPAPSADTQVWSAGLPPNGAWQVDLTTEDFERMGLLHSSAIQSAGVYTWTFQDGESIEAAHLAQGRAVRCEGTYAAVEDVVRITNGPGIDCTGVVYDIQWRLDADGLHLHLAAIKDGGPLFDNRIHFEAKPWQKVEAWSSSLPPNGVWQVELTAEDFVKMGTLNSVAAASAGVYAWTFQDGSAEFTIHGPALNVACVGVATVVGDAVRLQWDGSNGCDAAAYDAVQWRLDPEGLHFQVVGSSLSIDAQLKATYESKPWQQQVEAWSPGLPPNGVWQVTETVEDFVRMGLLRSVAQSDWAGVTTLTLQDGKSLEVWQGESGKSGKCQANYEMVGDVVRFTYFGSTNECPNRVDEMQWRLDDEGLLHLHLVSTKNAPFIEIRSYLEAKPWQKIQ